MEESKKFIDLYVKWNEEGKLKDNLLVLSMIVKSGCSDKQIARYYGVSLENLKELKKKYPEFAYAFDKDNINLMVENFKTLLTIARGYSKKIPRKQFYKNKKGEDKYTLTETDIWYEPDVKSVTYILEKFFGPQWRYDSELLKLQEKKIDDKKERWKNGNSNDEY